MKEGQGTTKLRLGFDSRTGPQVVHCQPLAETQVCLLMLDSLLGCTVLGWIEATIWSVVYEKGEESAAIILTL